MRLPNKPSKTYQEPCEARKRPIDVRALQLDLRPVLTLGSPGLSRLLGRDAAPASTLFKHFAPRYSGELAHLLEQVVVVVGGGGRGWEGVGGG